MKYCTKCGNRLPDDARFCTKCGAEAKAVVRVSVPETKPAKAAPKIAGQAQQTLEKINKKYLAVIAAVLVLVIAAALIVPGLLSSKNDGLYDGIEWGTTPEELSAKYPDIIKTDSAYALRGENFLKIKEAGSDDTLVMFKFEDGVLTKVTFPMTTPKDSELSADEFTEVVASRLDKMYGERVDNSFDYKGLAVIMYAWNTEKSNIEISQIGHDNTLVTVTYESKTDAQTLKKNAKVKNTASSASEAESKAQSEAVSANAAAYGTAKNSADAKNGLYDGLAWGTKREDITVRYKDRGLSSNTNADAMQYDSFLNIQPVTKTVVGFSYDENNGLEKVSIVHFAQDADNATEELWQTAKQTLDDIYGEGETLDYSNKSTGYKLMRRNWTTPESSISMSIQDGSSQITIIYTKLN